MTGTAGLIDPADAVYIDLINIPISSGISAGIRLRPMMIGLVPIYEEHAARKSENYNLQQWADLPRFDRALTVAMYRTERAVEAHQSEAEMESIKKK